MTNPKYGQLLGNDIKIHRQYFREMVKLYGIYVLYRAPISGQYENKKHKQPLGDQPVTDTSGNQIGVRELQKDADPSNWTTQTQKVQKNAKYYSMYGELDAQYEKPLLVGCLFEQHPNQQTLRKLGWMSELNDGASVIHVDYDLPNLQQGALFIVPSGLDDGNGRLFRVTKMATSMVYPSSVTCEIVPEYINTFDTMTGHDIESFEVFEDQHILEEEIVGPVR